MQYADYEEAFAEILLIYEKKAGDHETGLAPVKSLPASLSKAESIVRNMARRHGILAQKMVLGRTELLEQAGRCKALLMLEETDGGIRPLVLQRFSDRKFRLKKNDSRIEFSNKEPENLPGGKEGRSVVFLFLPLEEKENSIEKGRWVILGKLGRLLQSHKKEIGHILIYGVIAGLISLSLPLGVQSIIGYVSGGQIVTSVVVLIVFIVVGLLISGSMQYMQLYISEHIQQKIFVHRTFGIAEKIPRVNVEALYGKNPREIMNRFFEIVTLQKGTSVLLLELSAAGLQILFGILLISFYHPVFIFPGLILVILLVIVLRLTGPQGLETSLAESKYKYKVARWLEEMAGSLRSFKLTDSRTFVSDKTDDYVSGYLLARKKHFKLLSMQYLSFVLFKTLITGGLLSVGSYLIINNEISLGQFVAAEIIIILVMGAVEKLILKLDTIYDLLTGIEKLSQISHLPEEENGNLPVPEAEGKPGLHIRLDNIGHTLPGSRSPVLNGVSLEIKPGEKICLAGENGSGKTTLIQVLLGILPVQSGAFTINGMPFCNIDRQSLVRRIGHLTSMDDLFDGSVLENISLGREGITLEKVMAAISAAGLTDYIRSLPQGIETRIVGGDQYTSGSIARRILFARCIAGDPELIVFDNSLSGLGKKDKGRLTGRMLSRNEKAAVLIVSSDPEIMKQCDHVIVLANGQIAAEGAYHSVRGNKNLAELTSETEQ